MSEIVWEPTGLRASRVVVRDGIGIDIVVSFTASGADSTAYGWRWTAVSSVTPISTPVLGTGSGYPSMKSAKAAAIAWLESE